MLFLLSNSLCSFIHITCNWVTQAATYGMQLLSSALSRPVLLYVRWAEIKPIGIDCPCKNFAAEDLTSRTGENPLVCFGNMAASSRLRIQRSSFHLFSPLCRKEERWQNRHVRYDNGMSSLPLVLSVRPGIQRR